MNLYGVYDNQRSNTKMQFFIKTSQTICNEGMVHRVVKFGHSWEIPKDSEKPIDKRIKSGKYVKSSFSD